MTHSQPDWMYASKKVLKILWSTHPSMLPSTPSDHKILLISHDYSFPCILIGARSSEMLSCRREAPESGWWEAEGRRQKAEILMSVNTIFRTEVLVWPLQWDFRMPHINGVHNWSLTCSRKGRWWGSWGEQISNSDFQVASAVCFQLFGSVYVYIWFRANCHDGDGDKGDGDNGDGDGGNGDSDGVSDGVHSTRIM